MKSLHHRLDRIAAARSHRLVGLCASCRTGGAWLALLPGHAHAGACIGDTRHGPDWSALVRPTETP
jgi:hypothetical protein